MPTPAHIIRLTNATFNTLASHPDLSPHNPAINACLGSFVRALVAAEQVMDDTGPVLHDRSVGHVRPHLLRLLSRAESEMEMFFARRFLAKDTLSLNDLEDFWYLDNYRALVAQELEGLNSFNLTNHGTIAFIGAGPLPLSAIFYVLETGQNCICLDYEEEAATTGRALIEKLGLGDRIAYHHADGATFDYGPASLVFVAALCGGKPDILRRIRSTTPRATVAVRSASGLMALLYEPVDIGEVCATGYAHHGTQEATAQTVNSTCFFRHAA